ncbi:universal stress protein [Sphaerobacter thermophilus]|jgi:nucleotide-binding universal stress UspA family protein|uniref:UspA domain protein n=1 Tax=Sphaerobacter thermophilus (strain ATCC 49802 / DSM 20745 / KCCM 41009 / NCIMB 13125 / S 6022) TaxID=479434 RepID=D1C764_SPHTD|nr:universal stress protein [Sphaerobacter thermophilus]ACZ39710.1 UspA domain protein [Sphaerobacter thermophilus DSM 20745]PZN65569.1 MAG: universal stress protein [Sphaerobacter thermophilus]
MIGTVIVPLDGSELAEEALPFAAAIAERSGAPLHLMRVIAPDEPASAEEEARTYLRGKARSYGDRVQISIRIGDAAEQIVDGAEEMIDPVIVMTTRGRSGIGRWIYGSVAERVVRGAGVPVLLIRSGMAQPEGGTFRRIMVPLDGSAYAEAALSYAVQIARAFDAELSLVRVAETTQIYAMLTPPAQTPPAVESLNEVVAQLIADANAYLAKVGERLQGEGLRVRTQTLEGIAAEQLLAYEQEEDIDLVVMATHGRSGFSRLVFGSVAERVLKLGKTPVMMVKPKGAIAESGDAGN